MYTGPEDIRVLARNEAELAPGLRQIEVYTPEGLLTMFWHGDPGADGVAVMCGGAMGSTLGPGGGLYHDLSSGLVERGFAAIRVGYRRPNDLTLCVSDLMAACVLAGDEAGVPAAVTVGHSFGGAVAVCAAIELPLYVRGVVTLATQSAGCESAALIGGRPLILFHGDRDTILPVDCSEMVRMIAGEGELVVLPGAGHGLGEARTQIRDRLLEWIPDVLTSPPVITPPRAGDPDHDGC